MALLVNRFSVTILCMLQYANGSPFCANNFSAALVRTLHATLTDLLLGLHIHCTYCMLRQQIFCYACAYNLRDPQEKGSREGTRFLLGPSTARSHHTNGPVRINLFDQFCKKPNFVFVLDIATPTQEIYGNIMKYNAFFF